MRSWLPLLYSFICHLFILWLLFKLQFYYSVCEVLWLPRICRVLIPFEKNFGCFFKGFWPYGLLDSKGLKSLPFSCPRWNHTGGMAVSGSALLLHVREFDGLPWRHLGVSLALPVALFLLKDWKPGWLVCHLVLTRTLYLLHYPSMRLIWVWQLPWKMGATLYFTPLAYSVVTNLIYFPEEWRTCHSPKHKRLRAVISFTSSLLWCKVQTQLMARSPMTFH